VVEDHLIEVNEIEVRRALARSFTGHESGRTHLARRDRDRRRRGDGRRADHERRGDPYVEVAAPSIEHPELDGRLARTLLIENAELVLGRFRHADGTCTWSTRSLRAPRWRLVEVQASVWAVAWAADAFAHRLEALLREATRRRQRPRLRRRCCAMPRPTS
jgi:hypothetical protein